MLEDGTVRARVRTPDGSIWSIERDPEGAFRASLQDLRSSLPEGFFHANLKIYMHAPEGLVDQAGGSVQFHMRPQDAPAKAKYTGHSYQLNAEGALFHPIVTKGLGGDRMRVGRPQPEDGFSAELQEPQGDIRVYDAWLRAIEQALR